MGRTPDDRTPTEGPQDRAEDREGGAAPPPKAITTPRGARPHMADEDALLDEQEDLIERRTERVAPTDRPIEFGPPPEAVLPAEAVKARVVAIFRDNFKAETASGQTYRVFLARRLLIRERKFRYPVAVGDEVTIEPIVVDGAAEPQAQLLWISPRRSVLSRAAAKHDRQRRWDARKEKVEQVVVANVDQLVVVMAATADRAIRTNLIDRFLIAAIRGQLAGVVVMNKSDLILPQRRAEFEDVIEMYRGLGYSALLTSAVSGEHLDELRGLLRDKISVFAGPSGVGKSSLLNVLQPGLNLRTQELRKSGDGRHTTSTTQLIKLDTGGYVADTPGIREFGLLDLEPHDVYGFFPEIAAVAQKCNFRDCSHTGREPGCKVIQAVSKGKIHSRRYDSFVALVSSLESEM